MTIPILIFNIINKGHQLTIERPSTKTVVVKSGTYSAQATNLATALENLKQKLNEKTK